MKKGKFVFLIIIVFFTVTPTCYAKCSDYKAKKSECDNAIEDGYKCKYRDDKKGFPCEKSNVLAEKTSDDVKSADNNKEKKETSKSEPDNSTKNENYGCHHWNINECEKHSEDGFWCRYSASGHGRCVKGDKVVIEEIDTSIYNSCDDVNSIIDADKRQAFCNSSMVKGKLCLWKQGKCYDNGVVDTGTNETVIAGDLDQRDEEMKKRGIKFNDDPTKASWWDSTDGNTEALAKKIYSMIKIIVPLLVIVLSIADYLKVLFVSEDKNYKAAFNKFIKRISVGIILFLLPVLISLILNIAGLDDMGGIISIFS